MRRWARATVLSVVLLAPSAFAQDAGSPSAAPTPAAPGCTRLAGAARSRLSREIRRRYQHERGYRLVIAFPRCAPGAELPTRVVVERGSYVNEVKLVELVLVGGAYRVTRIAIEEPQARMATTPPLTVEVTRGTVAARVVARALADATALAATSLEERAPNDGGRAFGTSESTFHVLLRIEEPSRPALVAAFSGGVGMPDQLRYTPLLAAADPLLLAIDRTHLARGSLDAPARALLNDRLAANRAAGSDAPWVRQLLEQALRTP